VKRLHLNILSRRQRGNRPSPRPLRTGNVNLIFRYMRYIATHDAIDLYPRTTA
jgi:hypothetical protein